jgi:hypothetical protein
MQLDAIHRQLHRERSGMRALFVAALDRLVRDKPGIAAAARIAPAGVAPTRDVALVRVRNTERQSVDGRSAFRREVEDVFVAVVEETRRANRLEVTA